MTTGDGAIADGSVSSSHATTSRMDLLHDGGAEDGVAAGAAAAFLVAPQIRHVTPFLAAQEQATRIVLAQIHPELGLTRTTLTILLRFQDRIAHYLLHRAFHGEERSAAIPWTFDTPDTPLEENTVLFRFPTHVTTGELERHAASERAKAFSRAARLSQTVIDFTQVGLQFGHPLAARWFHDFIRGMDKEKESEAAANDKGAAVAESSAVAAAADTATGASEEAKSAPTANDETSSEDEDDDDLSDDGVPLVDESCLPLPMQSMSEKIALCAIVEYITAELLELAGNRAMDGGDDTINPIDLWCAVARDEELYYLFRFLAVDWEVTPNDDHPLDETSIGTTVTDLPPVTSLLEREFGAQGQAMAVMNASSWYMDPAKLLQYAQQFARGDREEAPITRSLRSLHVRPTRFWGCDTFSLMSERPSHDPEDDEVDPDPALGFIYVSFTVTDKLGEEWHLMLEVAPRQNWRGTLVELHTIAGPLGSFKRSQKGGVDTMHVHLNSVGGLRKTGNIAYAPYETAEVAAEDETEIEMQIMNQIRSLQEKLKVYTKKKKEEKEAEARGKEKQEEERKQSDEEVILPLDASVMPVAVEATTTATDATDAASSSTSTSSSSSSSSSSTTAADSSSSITSSPASSFNSLSILTAVIPIADPSKPPTKAATAAAAAAAAVPMPPPRITYASTSRLEILAQSLSQVTQQVASSHAQTELERLVPHLLHLIQFSKWGPTLYTDNQPIAIRRQFTSMLLDEAMHVNSQPPLPTDLLGIIAEYAPLDLPYLEDEARLQWKQHSALPFPATRALYPGQINNAIERHDQLANSLDEVLGTYNDDGFDGDDGHEDDEEDLEDD